jgi:hypothetical protein
MGGLIIDALSYIESDSPAAPSSLRLIDHICMVRGGRTHPLV